MTLRAGDEVTVDEDGEASESIARPVDERLADEPWLQQNDDLDADAGRPRLAPEAADPTPADGGADDADADGSFVQQQRVAPTPEEAGRTGNITFQMTSFGGETADGRFSCAIGVIGGSLYSLGFDQGAGIAVRQDPTTRQFVWLTRDDEALLAIEGDTISVDGEVTAAPDRQCRPSDEQIRVVGLVWVDPA